MTAASDPGFLVLHVLRLKGFADTGVVASMIGPPAGLAADRHLAAAAAEGLASRREGRITGWSLTPAGRARHAELVASEVDAAGARPAVTEAYRTFLTVNHELLRVCTDWQLRDGALNDHGDAAYDASVVRRLKAVDGVVQPVCAALAATLERFCDYGPRLSVGLARVEAGDGDWFAKPLIDSYHSVWFELHEDLLSTLGIERSKEGSPL